MRSRTAALCLALPLAACVLAACAGQPDGFSRAMDYSSVVTMVESGGASWRVLEHPGNGPTSGRIMTTPTLGKAAESGAVQGLTLGIANVDPALEAHRAAARARLDASGRAKCRITDGYELIRIQYEFVYVCEGARGK